MESSYFSYIRFHLRGNLRGMTILIGFSFRLVLVQIANRSYLRQEGLHRMRLYRVYALT